MPVRCLLALLCLTTLSSGLQALELARQETNADAAMAKYGIDGSGVTVVVLDRGIDWDHPDFINPDGSTRIRWMLDQSGFNLCNAANPAPVEYSAADINAALAGGPGLAMRDAVGHGTATAGVAAGNGRALSGQPHKGFAPGADLVVVKLTSEGAPAHGGVPAEAPFQGCIETALDWAEDKMDALDQPAVAIINSGVQWGPMDGTSAVSRKLDAVFGENTPGRVAVMPSGDEGSLPTHARATFNSAETTTIGIRKAATQFTVMSGWYSGDQPAELTVEFDDGGRVGPVGPNQNVEADGIRIINYLPGTEFYPWKSDSGDRAFWIGIEGHATTGRLMIRGINAGQGTVDVYGDVTGPNLTPVISMRDHLVPGRLNDYASTRSAIVAANHVIRTTYTDIDGIARRIDDEGLVGELWLKSSAGPSRDGRRHGVDVSAPGQNVFAPVGPNSYWATLRGNLPQGSNRLYTRFGGTSASAPMIVGTVALLLEMDPGLTAGEIREILRDTAGTDDHTAAVPNLDWGWGKMDVLAAADRVAEGLADTDGDGVSDVVDNCPFLGNANQINADEDGLGDACDPSVVLDADGDLLTGPADNCPQNANPGQQDADGDGLGDACDRGAGDIPVLAALSGSIYDPATSGQGFALHLVRDDTFVIYFYGYQTSGEPLWLIGTYSGAIDLNEPMAVDMLAVSGGRFGNFDPDDISLRTWGSATLTMSDCDRGTISLTGEDGSQILMSRKLAGLDGLLCGQTDQAEAFSAGLSGSWYDPTTSGQGFALHLTDNDQMVIYHYGFADSGDPQWLIGVYNGRVRQDKWMKVQMLKPEGGNFGDFEAGDVTNTVWGDLFIRFDDCINGTAWMSNGVETQQMDLILLAGIAGVQCR